MGQTPYDPETAAQALLDSGAFSDALDTVDQDTAAALYGIVLTPSPAAPSTPPCPPGAGEIAVGWCSPMRTRQRPPGWAGGQGSRPEGCAGELPADEVSKLDSAIVEQRGSSVLLAVAADAEKARAALDGLE